MNSSSQPARLRPFRPQPFGRYTLLSHLATGGMGEIYLARLEGAQGFEKLCVIKKILPQLAADPEFVERFVGEARTLVKLSHGSIAQVLDMGLHEAEAYMALEYVDGKDLRKVAGRVRDRQSPLPLTFILYVMGRVLDALAYAHRKRDDDEKELKLVHRDISPQNILISYEGEVKVIDFGLAKSRLSAAKTNPSIILGKFLYMSPEQARHQPVDRRSDLYAVGLCLYELISGKNPFDAVPPGELMSAVANPKVAGLNEVEPLTPSSVVQLVAKALAVDPSQRFQTAEEFRGRLQTCLMEIDASAGPESVSRFMRDLFAADFVSERRLLASLKDVPRMMGVEARGAEGAPSRPTTPMLPPKTIRLDGPVEPLSFHPTPRSREGDGQGRDDGETRPGVMVDDTTRPAFPVEQLEEEARVRARRGTTDNTVPSVEVRPEALERPEVRSTPALQPEPGAISRPGASDTAPGVRPPSSTREVPAVVLPAAAFRVPQPLTPPLPPPMAGQPLMASEPEEPFMVPPPLPDGPLADDEEDAPPPREITTEPRGVAPDSRGIDSSARPTALEMRASDGARGVVPDFRPSDNATRPTALEMRASDAGRPATQDPRGFDGGRSASMELRAAGAQDARTSDTTRAAAPESRVGGAQDLRTSDTTRTSASDPRVSGALELRSSDIARAAAEARAGGAQDARTSDTTRTAAPEARVGGAQDARTSDTTRTAASDPRISGALDLRSSDIARAAAEARAGGAQDARTSDTTRTVAPEFRAGEGGRASAQDLRPNEGGRTASLEMRISEAGRSGAASHHPSSGPPPRASGISRTVSSHSAPTVQVPTVSPGLPPRSTPSSAMSSVGQGSAARPVMPEETTPSAMALPPEEHSDPAASPLAAEGPAGADARLGDVDTHPRFNLPRAGARHDDTQPRVVLDEALLRDVEAEAARPKTGSRRIRASSPGMPVRGNTSSGMKAVVARPAPVEVEEEDDVPAPLPSHDETRRTVMPVRPEPEARRPEEHTRRTARPTRPPGKVRAVVIVTLLLLGGLGAAAAALAFIPGLRQFVGVDFARAPSPPPAEPLIPRTPTVPPPPGHAKTLAPDPKPAADAHPATPAPAADESLDDDSLVTPLEPSNEGNGESAPGHRGTAPTRASKQRPPPRGAKEKEKGRDQTPLQREWSATSALYLKLVRDHDCASLRTACMRYNELADEVAAAGDTNDPSTLTNVRKLHSELVQRQKELP
ncbi:serine/threonine protein kinase [Corallococcus sp. H22C18031201]|nr:serine/threonine protein kinase [Corallococcus sp. H22C18031201]